MSLTVEDFTTYTEVDQNSHLSKTAYHVDFKAYYNEDCYLYKDKGANHFGSVWEHKIDVTAIDRSGNSLALCEGLANAIDDYKHAGNEVGVYIYYSNGAASYRIYLFEYYSSTEYVQAYSISAGTSYYLTIKKDGTALTCKIYSDSARTNLLTTLSLTLHADLSYQYVYAAQSSNTGSAYWLDVDIGNLDLQEGGAIVKEVVDSLSLSDALLRNKTLAISDSVGLADFPLRDKTFTVTDSISLSEIIEVVTGAIIKYVADTIGLTEQIKVDKIFIVSDTMNLVDAVSTPMRVLHAVDSIGLWDNAYINKTLIISDQMALAEIVEKTVAGAVKTRIFLIVGDLAIQIAG